MLPDVGSMYACAGLATRTRSATHDNNNIFERTIGLPRAAWKRHQGTRRRGLYPSPETPASRSVDGMPVPSVVGPANSHRETSSWGGGAAHRSHFRARLRVSASAGRPPSRRVRDGGGRYRSGRRSPRPSLSPRRRSCGPRLGAPRGSTRLERAIRRNEHP